MLKSRFKKQLSKKIPSKKLNQRWAKLLRNRLKSKKRKRNPSKKTILLRWSLLLCKQKKMNVWILKRITIMFWRKIAQPHKCRLLRLLRRKKLRRRKSAHSIDFRLQERWRNLLKQRRLLRHRKPRRQQQHHQLHLQLSRKHLRELPSRLRLP